MGVVVSGRNHVQSWTVCSDPWAFGDPLKMYGLGLSLVDSARGELSGMPDPTAQDIL